MMPEMKVGISHKDREFLEEVFQKIEQNMGNSEYNVNKLSDELGISRVQVYWYLPVPYLNTLFLLFRFELDHLTVPHAEHSAVFLRGHKFFGTPGNKTILTIG
jgi:hypothetical protein